MRTEANDRGAVKAGTSSCKALRREASILPRESLVFWQVKLSFNGKALCSVLAFF